MEKVLLEVYSHASNMAVVKAPGRKFPGVVIQGDTLARLCALADEVVRALAHGEAVEGVTDTAEELLDELHGRLLHYQFVLDQAGVALPYTRRRSSESRPPRRGPPSVAIADWIFEDNLRAFVESLSWLIDYCFDGRDWTAIKYGVAEADAEEGRWYTYELIGPGEPARTIALELAPDVGTSVVHVKVTIEPSLAPAVRQSLAIFAHVRGARSPAQTNEDG